MKGLLLTLLFAAFVVGIPAYAHHSYAAEYFEDQRMLIEGELTMFEYKSPHAWIHVRVKDKDGQIQHFAGEWHSPNRLNDFSIAADTLKPGDRLIVSGSPGRNASERKLHLKGIERPADGWKWGSLRGRS